MPCCAWCRYSFGKFLELTFYNHSIKSRHGGCTHCPHTHHIRLFGHGQYVAAFRYRKLRPLDVKYTMVMGADVQWCVVACAGGAGASVLVL